MNSPQKNNYIQYVNQSGFVKTRNVIFVDNGETTTFDVGGINEDFFIFAVFQNNIQRFGIGFENFDNNDMLGFINTSVVDLGLVPSNAFLASEQVVTMSYNNAYVKRYSIPLPETFSVYDDAIWGCFSRDVNGNQIRKNNQNIINVSDVSPSKCDRLVYVEDFLKQNFSSLVLGVDYVINPINRAFKDCEMNSAVHEYKKIFYVKFPFIPNNYCTGLTKWGYGRLDSAEMIREYVWVESYNYNYSGGVEDFMVIKGYEVVFVVIPDKQSMF